MIYQMVSTHNSNTMQYGYNPFPRDLNPIFQKSRERIDSIFDRTTNINKKNCQHRNNVTSSVIDNWKKVDKRRKR